MGNGELHCPSIEPVTNSSANGPVPSSFEKTNYCVSRHDSHGGILAPKEEQSMQNGDPQLTGHGLLYLLLIIGLFAYLLVGCNGSSTMRLDSSVELQFYYAVFNVGQHLFPLESLGLDKRWKIPRGPVYCVACMQCGLSI